MNVGGELLDIFTPSEINEKKEGTDRPGWADLFLKFYKPIIASQITDLIIFLDLNDDMALADKDGLSNTQY